jgi:type II secretory pathway pseudopilin PulG
MLTLSETVTDALASPRSCRFCRALWLTVGVVAAAGLVLLVPGSSHRDAVRLVDMDMTAIREALHQYRADYGAFPVGDGAAVFKALRGQNPRQIVYLECGAKSVSSDGSMHDPWGTPYRLYFSSEEVLIRSAGPNRHFEGSADAHFDDCIR